ncbi:MAG: hypothetical protein GTN38_03510 [Candidatus Aenigmarchaeota archaeon]|nr:hypothetical protein [Candidatus Aenigmarchaeota archaeon]NIP40728.1 hypothetical protein [Candidatus Aenigmarchaeota archaeon]NIQ18534.1 hypothetical protein [Candidatus Aenigmarchaeota archaeon]NIS73433.1 hypothetical protein [Candidatus Aenigmarchaeota archaeon]
MAKHKKAIIIILLLIVFIALLYLSIPLFICPIVDGVSCNNITLTGIWNSDNDYVIEVKNLNGSSLDNDNPIFENEAYCQIFLKENDLSFDEFKNYTRKISGMVRTYQEVKETVSNVSIPYRIQLEFNQCYPFGGFYCPGYEVNIDTPPCFFYQIDKETDPNIALQVCEKTTLDVEGSSKCYRIVALKFADVDTDMAVALCDRTAIFGIYEKLKCYKKIVIKLAEKDISKAIDICEIEGMYCRGDVIEHYQNTYNITGEKLVKECLYYELGDKVTERLCAHNSIYLYGWQGHHDLVYMYGNGYSEKAKILCDKMLLFYGSDELCLKKREGTIKEINRPGSALNQFVLQHPDGLGEPQ